MFCSFCKVISFFRHLGAHVTIGTNKARKLTFIFLRIDLRAPWNMLYILLKPMEMMAMKPIKTIILDQYIWKFIVRILIVTAVVFVYFTDRDFITDFLTQPVSQSLQNKNLATGGPLGRHDAHDDHSLYSSQGIYDGPPQKEEGKT